MAHHNHILFPIQIRMGRDIMGEFYNMDLSDRITFMEKLCDELMVNIDGKRHLIEEMMDNIDIRRQLLMFAISNNKYEMCRLILNGDMDVNFIYNIIRCTPLQYAVREDIDNNIVLLLLQAGANPNFYDRFSPLSMIISTKEYRFTSNRLDSIRLLMEYGANPNMPDDGGQTAYTTLEKNRKRIGENFYHEILDVLSIDDIKEPEMH